MAEFNRKALFAGRSQRGNRGGPPILIALIFYSCEDCGGGDYASIAFLITYDP